MLRLAALILFACATTGWAQQRPARPVPTSLSPPPAIDALAPRVQLSAQEYTTLSAEIGAKISEVLVREGQSFKAGQALVRLDCTLEKAQRAKAQATLDAAQKIDAANRRLAELNSIGQLEVASSQAEVAKSKADVDYMAALLNKCTIAAPFAGRVAAQLARSQQFVQAGQPLLDIIDNRPPELEFLVPSRWLSWLKSGQSFGVSIDETGQRYNARVTRVGARVDPVSQSVKVVGSVDGAPTELMAGMSGQAHFTLPD